MNLLFLLAPLLLAGAERPALQLSPADTAAAFRAAGFTKAGKQWRKCADPGTASYTPGAIEDLRDINGDGRLDAVITESSAFCFGDDGSAFAIVSKQTDGSWRLIAERSGMATFLGTKGRGGWPDLEVGGPGFCFAVERWDGQEYRLNRREYEGKRCR